MVIAVHNAKHDITLAQSATEKYEPTEVEKLKLQLAQKDAQLAQQQFNYAQQSLNVAITAFRNQSNAIVKAHGWPDDVEADYNTLEFALRPKPGAKSPEPAKKP
ncbi:MAG TPA: hypothetical protein VND65_17970 [Candidatus Binatia bacterium]|nr:hypothetical protein [Candidatus Binatia bacterium]